MKIPFLEVWVGQFCNLRCKNCCHLIPHLEQCIYDIDEIIRDCRKMIKWCCVDFFSIVGGEPFCHPQLYKLLDYVAQCPEIKTGKIVTNGTVLPKEKTMESLKKLKGKLEIRINGYPGIGLGIAEAFADALEKNKIPYHFTRYRSDKPSSWKQLTPDGHVPLNTKRVKFLFSKCNIRDCNTLANGEFALCPRGIGSEGVFQITKNKYEHVNIRNMKNGKCARARIATCMNRTTYKEYCKYCLSLSEINKEFVQPGGQMNEK